jgi:hypothetical protein
VDQLLVEKLFHGQNPIGQVLHMSARPDHLVDETVEIVGIVPTLRDDLTEARTPTSTCRSAPDIDRR